MYPAFLYYFLMTGVKSVEVAMQWDDVNKLSNIIFKHTIFLHLPS